MDNLTVQCNLQGFRLDALVILRANLLFSVYSGVSCCLSILSTELLAVVKPVVQNMYKCWRSRKCIQGHIPMHVIFAVFIYFFIPVLSRPSFTSRTPNKDQKIEQLFYCPVAKALLPGDIYELRGERFCQCYLQVFTKVPRAKSGTFLVHLD